MSYTSQSGDINLDVKRVVAYRHWCNKLWNAVRFAMIHLPNDFVPSTYIDLESMQPSARWILSRLCRSIRDIVAGMEAYEFGNATKVLYAFWMDDVCDVFIEIMKPVMSLEGSEYNFLQKQTREALWLCLDNGLRLLHPFMPFVTEELWQRLPKRSDQTDIPSIMVAPYPSSAPEWIDDRLEDDMKYINQVVTATRQIRADYGLVSNQKPPLFIVCTSERLREVLQTFKSEIGTLSYSVEVTVLEGKEGLPSGCSVMVFDADTSLHLQLTEILDPIKEIEKLKQKLNDAERAKDKLEEKISKPSYQEGTPENIRKMDQEQLEKRMAEITNLKTSLESMETLRNASTS